MYIFCVDWVSVWIVLLVLFCCEVCILWIDVSGVELEVECVDVVILLLLCSDCGWILCFDVIYSDSICSGCFGKLLVIG